MRDVHTVLFRFHCFGWIIFWLILKKIQTIHWWNAVFFHSLEASGNFKQFHDIGIFDTILRNDRLLPLHCYNSLLNICMLLHIWMKAFNFHINRIFDHWPSSNSSSPLSISLIVILQFVCHFTSYYGILTYFFVSKIWL